jgi:hypothetical protein
LRSIVTAGAITFRVTRLDGFLFLVVLNGEASEDVILLDFGNDRIDLGRSAVFASGRIVSAIVFAVRITVEGF